MALWHFLVHLVGADGCGPSACAAYGHWSWYYFDSGFGNGSWLLTLSLVAIPVYLHHRCHIGACWRWGRYPVAGGQFRVCRHHNPDLLGEKPTMELVTRLHTEWKRGCHHDHQDQATVDRAA